MYTLYYKSNVLLFTRDNSSMVWKALVSHGGGSQHLIAKARKTYRAVAPCLLGLEPGLPPGPRPGAEGPSTATNATFSAAIGKWKFPADAEEHYQDILARTKAYRLEATPTVDIFVCMHV